MIILNLSVVRHNDYRYVRNSLYLCGFKFKTCNFFNNEKEIKKFNYNHLNYFKSRTKVGYIAKNIKSIKKVLMSKNILTKKKSAS